MAQTQSPVVHSQDLTPPVPRELYDNLMSKLCTTFPSPPASTNLVDQTIIITGAASGLGLETARQLLGFNLSHLIIAVRTVERGLTAAKELRAAHPLAKIDVWALEMESYESVKAFVKRCDAELTRLDAVILNAGMADMNMKFAASGHEITMQVNHWSTSLLGALLLPVMKTKRGANTPHLTVISSDRAAMCKVPSRKEVPFLTTFDDEKWWNQTDRYGESKLAGQLFFRRLAEHVSPQDVIINMVEPGFMKGTGLLRNVKGPSGYIVHLARAAFAHNPEHGAWTYIDAAIVRGQESHGDLINKGKVAAYAPLLYGPEGKALIDQVWKETIAEFAQFGVPEVLESMKRK